MKQLKDLTEYYDYITRYDAEERKAIEKEFKDEPQQLLRFLPSAGIYYWNGINPTKFNIKDVEVLSDAAEILEVIQEDVKSTPFMLGDEVTVTESGKLKARLDLYFNGKWYKDKINYTTDEINSLVSKISTDIFDNATPKQGSDEFNFTIEGMLKKGAVLKIIQLRHSTTMGRKETEKGKYSSIMFDFYIGGKFMHRDYTKNQKNVTQRFTVSLYNNRGIYDFSKYLKKI